MFGDLLTRHPTAFAHTVLTASLLVDGFTEVVVTGDRPDLVEVVRDRWLPGAVLAWGEPTASPLWEDRAGRSRLRLPELRLPAAGRRRRHPGGAAAAPASGPVRSGEPTLDPHPTQRHGP